MTVQLFLNISKNPYNTLEVLKTVLIYFALFFATTNTVASKREITSIITQVILVAFFASVLAILQAVLVQSGEVFPLQNILAKPYNTFGIALHANRFACYISMVIFLASGMFITNISNIKISLKNKSSIKHIFSTFFDLLINQKHLLLFFVLVTMVIALFLSRSRAGIFGLTTVSIIFLYAIFYKRYSKKVACSAVLIIFAFYLLLNWIGLSGVKEELETVFYNQKSYVDRTSTYLDATKMLGDYSFYGVGLGTFPDVFRAYRTQWVVEYGAYLFNDILQSDVLQFLCEVGIVGFSLILIPFIFFFLRFKYYIWNTHSNYKFFMGLAIFCSFLYLGLHSLIAPNLKLSSISSLSVLFLAIASLVMHYDPSLGEERNIVIKTRKICTLKSGKAKVLAYLVTVAAFGYFSFVILRPVIIYNIILKKPFFSSFQKAIRLDPKNPDLYFRAYQFFILQYKEDKISKELAYEKAEYAIRTAITLNPYKTLYVLAYAELERMAGNYEKALTLFKKVYSMEPNNPYTQMLYAYGLFMEGLREEDPNKKDLLLQKGLTYYNNSRSLGNTRMRMIIKDPYHYALLLKLLRQESIKIK